MSETAEAYIAPQCLSAADVSPEEWIGWLCAGGRIMFTNALPNINTLSFGIPNSALAVYSPVCASLPDLCSVRDDGSGHGFEKVVGRGSSSVGGERVDARVRGEG